MSIQTPEMITPLKPRASRARTQTRKRHQQKHEATLLGATLQKSFPGSVGAKHRSHARALSALFPKAARVHRMVQQKREASKHGAIEMILNQVRYAKHPPRAAVVRRPSGPTEARSVEAWSDRDDPESGPLCEAPSKRGRRQAAERSNRNTKRQSME